MSESAQAPAPMGRYVPAMRHGSFATSAGMTPRRGGELVYQGRAGGDVDAGTAREAAALAAENALAAVAGAAGGVERIDAVWSLIVYVRCSEAFTALSAVADGASERLEDLLGGPGRGRGTRAAVGVQSLPGGAVVEVQLTVVVS